MRWIVALVVTAAGVALGFAGLVLLRDDGPEELLPDLDQAVPSELAIVQEGDTYRLTFASAVDNVGRGPLLIAGERPDLSVRVMEVQQVVRSSDGSTSRRSVESRGSAPSARRHTRTGTCSASSTTSCERRDGELVPRLEDGLLPGRPVRDGPRHGARERAGPASLDGGAADGGRALTVSEGISPGYGDDYEPALEGQYLDVTSVPAGRYLLVHRANPDRTLEESDYDNNAASVLIQLRRRRA